jgi:hypothetical protein
VGVTKCFIYKENKFEIKAYSNSYYSTRQALNVHINISLMKELKSDGVPRDCIGRCAIKDFRGKAQRVREDQEYYLRYQLNIQ